MLRRAALLWSWPLLLLAQPAPRFPLHHVAVRENVPLTEWGFRADPGDEGADAEWFAPGQADARDAWPRITVPRVWDEPDRRGRSVSQVGWYASRVTVPPTWDGASALAFLGVQFTVDVFVNGEFLATHQGGYTPFLVDLADLAVPGEPLDIVLRVDNRLNETTIPKPAVGWQTQGGLTRECFLLHQPPARPKDLQVVTRRVQGDEWELNVRADTVGGPTAPMTIRLFREGRELARARVTEWSQGLDHSLRVRSPALWSPASPALHDLELSWGEDVLRLSVGFREIAFARGRLLLNGTPLWLQGFGQHETTRETGPVVPSDLRRRDLEQMKTLFRANAIRLGHYPNHPEIYHLCDELGLLAFTEIPVWHTPPATLNRPDVWSAWLEPQLREMALACRNHPSVFAWGVLNEVSGAHEYILKARDLLRSLDPTRPVTAVLDATHDARAYELTDFGARNLHYGWYHSRSVYAFGEGLAQNLGNAKGKAVWIAEFGGHATPGRLGAGYSDDVRGTETYLDKMLRFGLQHAMHEADRIVGISVWTWTDFWRGRGIESHGILDIDRAPKLAAWNTLNLMHADRKVLVREQEAVVPRGEHLRVRVSLFQRYPQAGDELRIQWRIQHGARVVQEGRFPPHTTGTAHTAEIGRVEWPVDELAESGLHHLHVQLHDADGKLLHSQALAFEAVETSRPGVLTLEPPPGGIQEVEVAGMVLHAYPMVGLRLALPEGDYTLRGGDWTQRVRIDSARETRVSWPPAP